MDSFDVLYLGACVAMLLIFCVVSAGSLGRPSPDHLDVLPPPPPSVCSSEGDVSLALSEEHQTQPQQRPLSSSYQEASTRFSALGMFLVVPALGVGMQQPV